MNKKKVEIYFKIWLENNGMAFGRGHYKLLKNIDTTNSLNKAALSLKMSYRQAWGMIRECEKKLGFSLIKRQVGGSSGGFSKLTGEGKDFLLWYEDLNSEINEAIQKIYLKKFDRSQEREKK